MISTNRFGIAFAFALALLLTMGSTTLAWSADLKIAAEILTQINSKDSKAAFGNCFSDTKPDSLTFSVIFSPDKTLQIEQSEPALSDTEKACIEGVLTKLNLPQIDESLSIIAQVETKEPEPTQPPPLPVEKKAASDQEVKPTKTELPKPSVPSKKKQAALSDPDDTRVIYASTAIPRGKGILDFTPYDIGYWDVEYGGGDNISIGLKFLLPVSIYEVMPYMRGSIEAAENIWLGATLHGGIAGLMQQDGVAWFAGGSAQATFGRDPVLFNTFFLAQAMGHTTIKDVTSVLSPSAGLSIRLSRSIKFNLEYFLPIIPDLPTVTGLNSWEYLWGIIGYGIRIFSKQMYGDIAFFCPIFKGAGEMYQYLPLGLPMLIFGFQFDTAASSEITSQIDASSMQGSWIGNFNRGRVN